MKRIIGIMMVLTVIASLTVKEAEFEQFTMKFNKVYANKEEKSKRFEIFQKTLDMINEHNAKNSSYLMGINQFSDLTYEEFASKVLQKPIKSKEPKKSQIRDAKQYYYFVPVDWRQRGAVTPIQNQGDCQSGYSFAAVGSAEGKCMIELGRLVKLSEQQCVDCSSANSNMGCNGGTPQNCINYWGKCKGTMPLENYPYVGSYQACQFSLARSVFNINNPQRQNLEQYLQKSVSYQPTSVGFNVQASFQNYQSGIYSGGDCMQYNSNHYMTVVGQLSDNGRYYIVKNSWGNQWGDNGYALIRADINCCGIANESCYPRYCNPL